MLLRLVLFISGAVVMSVEILASRVLAVEFGDSLQVWGALIGTFIGALSLGYWAGGEAADRWPTRRLLAAVVAAAGVLIAAFVPLPHAIASAAYRMPMSDETAVWAGPLILAAVLYAIPIALLGTVSPLCVKLAAPVPSRLGRRVGGFYAISSLGSIFGTFLTAFYLVGLMRVSVTILSEGALLVALSVVVFVTARGAKAQTSGENQ